MLDIKRIRENPNEIEEAIRKKGVDISVAAVLELDNDRRRLVAELDGCRAEQNVQSRRITNLKGDEREKALGYLKELKAKIDSLEYDLRQIEEKLELELYRIPNPPLEGVPEGRDDRDNVVMREEGEKPKFDFRPRDYLSIAQALDIVDIERAGKVSGSRFGYIKGDAAMFEFALLWFGVRLLTNRDVLANIAKDAGLDVPTEPFVPVVPPVLIRPEMLGRMGYLSKTRSGWENEEVYFMRDDELVLVGTSEQSIGPMHANETFAEASLPRRYLGFSSCFRREAGSYGKDTKGIIRVHQFDKLEMFSYTTPECSVDEHRFMLACEEYIMRQLKLAYRVVNICTGDLGAPAAAKFDVEAWLPGQNDGKGEYRETHSTSNTTDFQARRLNIRYRKPDGSLEFVHMLNGTAIAMGRMIIAIIENYQTKDGKVRVPDALLPYVGRELIGS